MGVVNFTALYSALAAVAPIVEFAGNPSVRATWRITFASGATDAQKAAAQAVLDACPETSVDLSAYTAAAHAALRDDGVTIAGMRIKTDAESRGLIDGAYALSQAKPDNKIDFKAASGWVLIDAGLIQTISVAVGMWVQACYSAYRQVDGKVTDGSITTPAQIDAAFAAVTLPA